MESINLLELYNNPDSVNWIDRSGYTIYRIVNSINNKSYIGDTKISIRWRFFDFHLGAHFVRYDNPLDRVLYLDMNKYGLDKFYLEILYNGEYDDNLESYYISVYDSFNSGYNNNSSGKYKDNPNAGRIAVHKGYTTRKVLKKDLDILLNDGWELGASYGPVEGKITINNGTNNKFISESELEDYTKLGWKLGSTPELINYKWVHKGDERTRVSEDKLDYYLSLGYEIGSNYNTHINDAKRVWINNGDTCRFAKIDEVDYYLNNGYKRGRLRK